MFNMEHRLFLMADTEAEEYFIKSIQPLCKDKVKVMIGDIFGTPGINTYIISHKDYKNVGKQLKVLRGY